MSKAGGSLGRGRRTVDETPTVPGNGGLNDLERRCQICLARLVDQAGGRFGLKGQMVAVDHVDRLADLFEEWARRHRDVGTDYFNGRPGLWQALDTLCPLQDPNRWDRLRQAVIQELEQERGWARRQPPRGAGWDLPAP